MSLGMQKLLSFAVSARAQGHTAANVLFSRCQQEAAGYWYNLGDESDLCTKS